MRTRGARRSPAEEPERTWTIPVPNDAINEQVVLAGAMVGFPETFDQVANATSNKPEAFFATPHRVLFEALSEMRRQRLDFDPATLARIAPGLDPRIPEMLLAARPDVPPNFEWHIDTLLFDWKRAQLAQGPIASIVESIQDPKADLERIRSQARAILEDLEGDARPAPYLRDSDEVVRELMANVRSRVFSDFHYDFGIPSLDRNERGEHRFRPGAAPGLITILTALSGSGKTTLAAHLILGLARQKRRVLVGAWEVLAPMTLELLTVLSLKWSRTKILDGRSHKTVSGKMTEEELQIFERTARAISRYVTFLDNPFKRSLRRRKGREPSNEEHLDILQEHIEASGADAVVLDLFDRCLVDRSPAAESEALWHMHEVTTVTRTHMVLVHQQLLKGEKVRADHKPSLENLKGSSAYVDVGHYILAPHLPAKWKDVPNNTLELFCLKYRTGEDPWGIEFEWDPERGQIGVARDIPYNTPPAADAPTSKRSAFAKSPRS